MINAYLTDLVTVWASSGEDQWGEQASGAFHDFKARVEFRTRLVRDINGETVPSTMTVLLPKKIDRALGRELNHKDRIQIEGESLDRAILSIAKPKHFSHPFYEVALA